MPTNSISVDQLNIKADSMWKKLDEVRIVDGNALYCKENVTTGLLMKDNQVQIVPVTWSNGTPTVGTMTGYITADGNYHIWDNGEDLISLFDINQQMNNLNLKNWKINENGTGNLSIDYIGS